MQRTLRLIDVVDPSLRLRFSRLPRPDAQLLCVYRIDNGPRVAALADECAALGWPVLLHALDAPHPALAGRTRSVGPGGRFENLNRLLPYVDADRWTVICDDDVLFPYSGLESLVAICRSLAIDIGQPAHRADSNYSHLFTRRRPGILARTTGFVEIGPAVVFSPAAWPLVTPFPEEGMGWGTDVQWHDLRDRGVRLGIVDSIPLCHLGMPAQGYDAARETKRLEEILGQRGLTSVCDLHYTVRTYPFWTINRLGSVDRQQQSGASAGSKR
jgi:hypothetical protein